MVDLLLTPDVAYLFLVVGSLFAVLALLTPGTGFFEIGAFFALTVAGWQVYSLGNEGIPLNLWALLIVLVAVVIFVLAIRRTRYQMFYLGGSIAALVLGSAYLFRGEGILPAVNPWLALIVSALSAGFLWLMATKTLDIHLTQPSHDLGKLMGARGVARTEIHSEGTVFVNMEDWSAQSEKPIAAGERVQVIGREGLILMVTAVQETE